MGSNIDSENLRSEISTSRDIQTRKRTRNHFYTPQIYLGYGSGTTTSRSMLPFFDLRRGSKTRARESSAQGLGLGHSSENGLPSLTCQHCQAYARGITLGSCSDARERASGKGPRSFVGGQFNTIQITKLIYQTYLLILIEIRTSKR